MREEAIDVVETRSVDRESVQSGKQLCLQPKRLLANFFPCFIYQIFSYLHGLSVQDIKFLFSKYVRYVAMQTAAKITL